MTESNAVFEAATELGIDLNSLDESSHLEAEAIDKEVESEVNEEEVIEPTPTEEVEIEAPEGEEEAPVEAPAEVSTEEPKLTAKEFQEIQAARAELEAQTKAFMEEKAALEKEFEEKYHEKIKTHDEIDAFFSNLASKEPELFDLVKAEFQEHQKQFSNPVIDEIRKETLALKKELEGFKAKASDEVTLTKLDSEMNKFNSTLGKEAETAGLKIDRKLIEDMWAKGLSVEEAFYAKYGAAFTKAQASKAKVEAVEKKVAARPAVNTAGSVARSNAPVSKDFSKMDTRDIVGYFARQVTGKA